MANVPNTTTSGQVLTSVGDGSNASKWGTVTSGGSSGITQLTGDVTAGPGSGSVAATVVKIQGKTVSTTAPSADGQLLVWNNSTSQWVPVSPSTDLALAASGTATVKGLNQQALPTSPASTGGEVLYYSTLAGAWRYGGLTSGGLAPTAGDVLSWNSSYGWVASTVASPGTNQVWSNSAVSASVSLGTNTTPLAVSGFSAVTVTGYTNYLVTYTASISSTSATTSGSIGVAVGGSIWFGSSAASQAINFQTMRGTAGDVYTYSITVPLNGFTPGTNYSVAPYAVVGAGTGTMGYGQITILGVS